MKKYIDTILFARSPVLGKVKQRLAKQTGERAALAIYRKLLRLSLRAMTEAAQRDPLIRPVLSHLGDCPDREIPVDFTGHTREQPYRQFSANLAREVSSPAGEDRRGVVVFGSDHPGISAAHIVDMVRLLDHYSVAVGPSEDGGFWALATNRPLDKVIAGLPLGTNQVLNTFLQTMKELGVPCGIGPPLWDVDNTDDLTRWKKNIAERK